MSKNNRDDFSTKVKDILAKRAGNRCSKCNKLTSGPNHDGGALSIGVAAHICAAAPGGPRYDEKMSPEERSSINNGIWLCQNCATEIDRDITRYSVQILRNMKNQAETRAHEELRNSNSASIESFSKTAHEVSSEIETITLLSMTGGKCQRCDRPLGVNKEDVPISYAKRVTLTDSENIIVCVACEREIHNLSDSEKNQLIADKHLLENHNAARDLISRHEIEMQIFEVLEAIHDMDVTEETMLKIEPIKVERKITEKLLKDRVLQDVTQRYDGVNNALDYLSGESRLNVDKFAKSVKRMFEDSSETLGSQSDIYYTLVDAIYGKSGRKHRTACEVIISYFVQRCEVFNEITE